MALFLFAVRNNRYRNVDWTMAKKKKSPKKKSPAKEKEKQRKKTKKEKKEQQWKNSAPKERLRKAIADGEFPMDAKGYIDTNQITYDQLFAWDPGFAKLGDTPAEARRLFTTRVRTLAEQVGRNQGRRVKDLAAFEIYKKNHPPSTHAKGGSYPQWDFSRAQELLNEAIDAGKHLEMSKQKLWRSQPEFKEFPLQVFRDHVYQEIKTRKYLHTLEVFGKRKRGGKPKPGA